MTRHITITAATPGWAIHIEGEAVPVAFASGARAEATARAIAGGFADAGVDAEIRVFLRDGALAGRFLAPARDRRLEAFPQAYARAS